MGLEQITPLLKMDEVDEVVEDEMDFLDQQGPEVLLLNDLQVVHQVHDVEVVEEVEDLVQFDKTDNFLQTQVMVVQEHQILYQEVL